jgi:predicted transcriptional regulator
VNEIEKRVLASFDYWHKDTLDLHELFEAGGNDPEKRTAVFYAVEQLVDEGLLQEEGNDFYSLTEKGKAASGKP